ncbi:helix-turn-helix domain-containing protein [Chryseobacterium vrystaatense]|uniref:Helix-turn-helix domain-containing protein n=1 Tax=Chryseobacterium vrystaatense TaxID=307480 RepID=A0A1M5DP13_9FLAO|nr:AraC family transcriptional regulator [Chryseobacterium vrystaatense]SHF68614.1 Helix-turn-helix domain-containing protein [Chryseobacterium vrystaatense]
MTNKPLYLLISIVLCSLPLRSQIKKDQTFDAAFFRSFREEGVDIMLKKGDSLYEKSESELQKVKSLVVIASAYSRKLNTSKSIKYWKKADSIARKEKLPDWIALSNERLAAEYLKLNLKDASKNFLQRAVVASKSLSGSLESKYTYAMMLETEALQKIEDKDTIGFLKSIKSNQAYLEKIPKNTIRDYLLGRSQLKLGEVYVQKNRLDSADYAFHLAEKNLKSSKIKSYYGESATLYRGLGNLALKRKQPDEAKQYFLKARKIALANNNREVTDLVINDLRKYYRMVGDHEGLLEINQIKDSIDLLKKDEMVILADQDYKDEFAQKSRFEEYTYIFIALSVLLVLFVIGLFLYYKQQRKKSRLQFEKIIEKLKIQQETERSESVAVSSVTDYPAHDIEDDSSLSMSAEKEEELVRRLKDFEKQELYLDQNISRPKMASSLHTNTKYLSYIIRKYRGLDFSDYINQNRINYITKKLYTEPSFRIYKISYLAELCGYSSHSRFANIFKKQMNISPSDFISQLQKRAKKNT